MDVCKRALIIFLLIATVKCQLTSDQQQSECAKLESAFESFCPQRRTDICHVTYNGKCFRIVLHNSKHISYSAAEGICNGYGAKKANIYSEDHYNILMTYARALMPKGQEPRNFWLGMKHDSRSGRSFLSDGTAAPFIKWMSGEPDVYGSHPYMGLDVKQSLTDDRQGIWDGQEGTTYGVVCEKKL